MSIGAINAAIIAGNPPNSRVDRLREFWTQVTADGLWPFLGDANLGLARGDASRNFLSQMSATMALASGAGGFFAARPVTPWLQPDGTIEATSFYNTRDLKRTLEHLVDFDRLNAGIARFSVESVNVRSMVRQVVQEASQFLDTFCSPEYRPLLCFAGTRVEPALSVPPL
jgi:NTE family protein